jgi:hypothetical protein
LCVMLLNELAWCLVRFWVTLTPSVLARTVMDLKSVNYT